MAEFPHETSFPFPKTAPASETTQEQATPVAAAVDAKPEKVKKAKKAPGERKTPAADMTAEQVKRIPELVKTMSYPEIAKEVGVTTHQVNRVLMGIKKKLRANAKNAADEAKIEKFILDNLTRPDDATRGRGGRGGAVAVEIDSQVQNILDSILK